MNKYRPFNDARAFVRLQNIPNYSKWQQYCRSGNKPDNIPGNPDRIYKGKGWTSWGDFLGSGNVATHNRIYLPFTDSRKYVHNLRLENRQAWGQYCRSGKKPDNIPTRPEIDTEARAG